MTHFKIVLILRTTEKHLHVSVSLKFDLSTDTLYWIETLRAIFVCSRELLYGERWWLLTPLVLDKAHEWIMNFQSGVEDATRGGKKKRRGTAVGVLMMVLEWCPLIGWRLAHDTHRQVLSSRRSIAFIISSLTVHQPSCQTGFWLAIDFHLGIGCSSVRISVDQTSNHLA